MNEYNPITSEFASAEEEAAYDAWFRKQVEEALAENGPFIPHDEAMAHVRKTLADARLARANSKTTEC